MKTHEKLIETTHPTKEIYLERYKTHLQSHATSDIHTNSMLAKIKKDKLTSASAFDLFCQSVPHFNIRTTPVKQEGKNGGYFDQTCLHLAVVKRNADLVEHLISKFGKEILFENDLAGMPIAVTAVGYFFLIKF